MSGGPSSASTSSSTATNGNVIVTLTDIYCPRVTAHVSEADIGNTRPPPLTVWRDPKR